MSKLQIYLDKETLDRGYVDVEKIARRAGIDIQYKDWEGDTSGAIKYDKENNKFIIFVNQKHSEVRQRFTIAHEIAHCYLHEDKVKEKAIIDDDLYASGLSSTTEREANKFAGGILMPSGLIYYNVVTMNKQYPDLEPHELVEKLARRLRVSEQALAIRLKIEGYIIPKGSN